MLLLLLGFIIDDFKYPITMCSEVSGDREVQRTMLELLNQLDGFSSDDSIKVCLYFVFSSKNALFDFSCWGEYLGFCEL